MPVRVLDAEGNGSPEDVAGNESFPPCSYPSFADQAVCAAATDRCGVPIYYSNFPNNKPMLGFRAPGGVRRSL